MKKIRCFIAGICFLLMQFSSDTTVYASCGQSSLTITSLPTLGGSSYSAAALNDVGNIAGFSLVTGDVVGHAFSYNGTNTVDLGTLGGSFSEALGLNHSGQVVGDANTLMDQATHAFLSTNNGIIDLGTLGGSFSSAVAINSSGLVVGMSDMLFGSQHAFLYANGSMMDLGTLGGVYSSAAAVNQNGMIVGISSTVGEMENHAFLRTNGIMLDLGTLGGNYSSAFALNDSGVVAGESTRTNGDTHGFVFSGGVMSDVGTLGGTYSTVSGINNAGMAFGVATTVSDAETHGFVFSGGVITDLQTLGGGYSEAIGINNAGQVVGRSTVPGGDVHAFLWQNGTLTDLNLLLPTNSGWTLQSAEFINDSGRIVGYGDHAGYQWFVLDLGSSSDQPPFAVAVVSQAGDCLTPAILDGSGSSDPDGDALAYLWTENNAVLGTNAILTNQFDLGTHTVTLTVADPCGQSSQTNVVVQVSDTVAPTISGAPGPINVTADVNCQAVVPNVLVNVTATDNCTPADQIVITQNPIAGTLVGDGPHSITVTGTDAAGNSASVQVTLNVVDKTAPTISGAPGPITLNADANCQAAVPNVLATVTATDNCTPANQIVINQDPTAGTLVGDGSHTIAVTATDAAGNSATVEVALNVVDNTAPVIVSRPESVALSDCPPVIPDIRSQIVAADNCTTADRLTITQNPTAGAMPGDERSITVTVTDASGNSTSTSIPFTVTDNTAPTIVSAPDSIGISNRLGLVPNVVPSIVATDNCTPADQLVIQQDPPAHTHLNHDLEAIVVTVTDAAGNQTSQGIPVVIRDKTAPLIQGSQVTPSILWPPNHKMVPVKVEVRARDNSGSRPVSKITSITANEPISPNDVQITGNLTAKLAASRDPAGHGRVYKICVECTDASGNSSTCEVNVLVPLNRSFRTD